MHNTASTSLVPSCCTLGTLAADQIGETACIPQGYVACGSACRKGIPDMIRSNSCFIAAVATGGSRSSLGA